MSAEQLANDLFNVSLVTMIITLVLGLGLGFTIAEVIAPMRRWGILIAAIIVNALVIPAVAWELGGLFPVTAEQRTAIALVCAAAAGPAGLKACQLAKKADMAQAVSLVVVLMLVNIISAPLWASAVVTGATVQPATIIKDLLLLVLIPLALGLAGRVRYHDHADAWKSDLEKVSNIALYIAIAIGLAVNWKDVVSLIGSWVLGLSVVLIVIYTALGWLVGLRDRSTAITVSMISAMRFTPIGLIVISTQLNNQPAYLAPALVFALIDTFVPFAIGAEIGRRSAATGGPGPSAIPTPPAGHSS